MTAVADACLVALANVGQLLHELAYAPSPANSAGLTVLRQQAQQHAAAAAQAPASGEGGTAAAPAPASGSQPAGGSGPALSGPSLSGASARPLGRVAGEGGATQEAYVNAEYAAVWQEMQEEVQLLLAELLQAQLRGLPAASSKQG